MRLIIDLNAGPAREAHTLRAARAALLRTAGRGDRARDAALLAALESAFRDGLTRCAGLHHAQGARGARVPVLRAAAPLGSGALGLFFVQEGGGLRLLAVGEAFGGGAAPKPSTTAHEATHTVQQRPGAGRRSRGGGGGGGGAGLLGHELTHTIQQGQPHGDLRPVARFRAIPAEIMRPGFGNG